MYLKHLSHENQLMEIMKEYFLSNQLNLIMTIDSSRNKKFWNLDFRNFLVEDDQRNILVEKFTNFNLKGALRVSPGQDELFRYFHALYKYRESKRRFEDTLSDFSYGFTPARNLDWIKNRIKYLNVAVQDEHQFSVFISNVRHWKPNAFTLEERFFYFGSLGIILSDDQKETYRQILEIDSSLWEESNLPAELSCKTAVEIFNAVVLSSHQYDDLKVFISSWSSLDDNLGIVENDPPVVLVNEINTANNIEIGISNDCSHNTLENSITLNISENTCNLESTNKLVSVESFGISSILNSTVQVTNDSVALSVERDNIVDNLDMDGSYGCDSFSVEFDDNYNNTGTLVLSDKDIIVEKLDNLNIFNTSVEMDNLVVAGSDENDNILNNIQVNNTFAHDGFSVEFDDYNNATNDVLPTPNETDLNVKECDLNINNKKVENIEGVQNTSAVDNDKSLETNVFLDTNNRTAQQEKIVCIGRSVVNLPDENYYFSTLKKKFNYSSFTYKSARTRAITQRKQLSINDWVKLFSKWESEKKISFLDTNKVFVRFNLKSQKTGFLTYEQIINPIKNKFHQSFFTTTELYRWISSRIRPAKADLEIYLSILEREEIIFKRPEPDNLNQNLNHSVWSYKKP